MDGMSEDLGEKGRVWLGQELGRVPRAPNHSKQHAGDRLKPVPATLADSGSH